LNYPQRQATTGKITPTEHHFSLKIRFVVYSIVAHLLDSLELQVQTVHFSPTTHRSLTYQNISHLAPCSTILPPPSNTTCNGRHKHLLFVLGPIFCLFTCTPQTNYRYHLQYDAHFYNSAPESNGDSQYWK
jgi:hypothetical protein